MRAAQVPGAATRKHTHSFRAVVYIKSSLNPPPNVAQRFLAFGALRSMNHVCRSFVRESE